MLNAARFNYIVKVWLLQDTGAFPMFNYALYHRDGFDLHSDIILIVHVCYSGKGEQAITELFYV